MARQSITIAGVTAVVLAGGQGTRIRPLYPDTAKPLIPVHGRPFLYWLTAFLARHGLRDFVYSTGFRSEQIEAWCRDPSLPGLNRRIRREPTPLGTGGGLLNCLDACADWVFVANGDSLCLDGVDRLLGLRTGDDLAGGLTGLFEEDTSRYGSLDVDDQGRLCAFREKAPGRGYINGGMYLFKSSALGPFPRGRPASIEHDLIPRLLADGAKIETVLLRDAPFIDIGTPESIGAADAFVHAHLDRFAWAG